MASRFCARILFYSCRRVQKKPYLGFFARPVFSRNHFSDFIECCSFGYGNTRTITADSHLRFASSGHIQGEFFENEDVEDENEISEDEMSKFDEEEEDDDDEGGGGVGAAIKGSLSRDNKCVDNEGLAEEIGYKVIGHFGGDYNIFKPYEPVFAVVQVGSHQFKVSNGDSIFTERLKFCEVNDKLVLKKVLLLGSSSQTIIGRPLLTDAAVYAVVEEHALDAKVIIFKKKRRKNYRRTRGHRQELTKLRIVDIHGIEKPKKTASKQEKTPKRLKSAAFKKGKTAKKLKSTASKEETAKKLKSTASVV